jgi:Flp pilus assembly protein protease CpaA
LLSPLKLVVTLWLLGIAYIDARTATIPNWLTLPAMASLVGWRLIRAGCYVVGVSLGRWGQCSAADVQALLFTIVAWGFCFALWELHILGGGDSKTLMGILALFPSADFVVFLSLAVLVLSLPLLVLKQRGKGWRGVPGTVRKRLQTGSLFPTQRELEEEGRPYAWTFCVPGVIYLWFLW